LRKLLIAQSQVKHTLRAMEVLNLQISQTSRSLSLFHLQNEKSFLCHHFRTNRNLDFL